jgi:hypothetical protein
MSELIYVCDICHKQVKGKQGKPAPLCCKKEMEPLRSCVSVPDPEISRNYREDEPCQDGSQPKKR